MSCRTGCCSKISLLVALLALGLLAVPAFAGVCMQDAYDAFNSTPGVTLNCTANDVSVAAVTGTTIISGGVGNSCLQGAPFTFVADFEVLTTSSKTRSNIGLFFGTGTGAGQNGALTGVCSDAILTPHYTCPGTGGVGQPPAVTCGSDGYEELDQPINGETSPNGCGDTTSADNGSFGPGTQAAHLEVGPITCPTTTVPCPPGTPGGITTCMQLPECTSWYQPTATMPVCNSPTHAWIDTAVPGTKSKCSCTTLFIPVQPITPSVSVGKTCDIGTDTTPNLTTCHAGAETHDVVYTVTINNTTPANEGGVVVDQICDNQYGTIYQAAGFGGSACPNGTISNSPSSTTCSASVPGTIDNGKSGSCTFTVSHGENLTVVDQVTVKGHSSLVSTSNFAPTMSNTVTVDSTDAPSTAVTNLGLEPGPQAACVTLRYDVTVQNTGAADESINVTGITDGAYGSITTTHGDAATDGSVVGTTCGVAVGSPGLGTLNKTTASSTNGGSFPQTLAAGTTPLPPPTTDGGKYQCMFDGVICGTPTSGAVANCAFGLSKPDPSGVTATLTGDDNNPADTIDEKANGFTANVCLVQTP